MARTLFVIPLLPKPHYLALKHVCTHLPARQGELICQGIELLAELYNANPGDLQARLERFRNQAPSETPSLIPGASSETP